MTPILETKNLVKRFGGLLVTNGCDLAIQPGEIHALIGPNGAGKTTLIGQLSGRLAPDAGQVYFGGKEITHLPIHRRVQRGLAQTYQITNIFSNQSVLENLMLSVQAATGHSFHFWRPRRHERDLVRVATAVAEEVGLVAHLQQRAGTLAHGQQRQLEIGLALACGATLLLLDEPMAGMGLEESAAVIELIRTINQRATILLVEHDMDAVFQLADRISVLVYGEIIATGTPAAIRQNAAVQEAYLGTS